MQNAKPTELCWVTCLFFLIVWENINLVLISLRNFNFPKEWLSNKEINWDTIHANLWKWAKWLRIYWKRNPDQVFSIYLHFRISENWQLAPVEILVVSESVCRMSFLYFFLVYCCSKSSPLPQSRYEQYWWEEHLQGITFPFFPG